MALFKPINPGTDTITETTKITKGFFTGDIGTVTKDNLVTSSLSTAQKKYYQTLQYSSEDQFSVTYGHKEGSGSSYVRDTNNIVGETEAIYKHFSNLINGGVEKVTMGDGGLGIVVTGSSGNALGSLTTDDISPDCYFLIAERARMKDRINRKNWTLSLSGSIAATEAAGSGSGTSLHLTDDSNDVQGVQTVVGPRFNIVSGSLGTVHTAASAKTYGLFYPNLGLIVLDTNQVATQVSGTFGFLTSQSLTYTNATPDARGRGLTPSRANNGTAENAWRFARCVISADQTFRNEEDQTTKSYFCRAHAADFNFSGNPTFASSSNPSFTIPEFKNDPQTFITSVGLFNPINQLVAVGKLSSPVKKNFQTEATIKVNLTY
tara:strand:- start:1138 stop:2268 length:1131 start_codon:yes stop_codon:yes gene_type:complete